MRFYRLYRCKTNNNNNNTDKDMVEEAHEKYPQRGVILERRLNRLFLLALYLCSCKLSGVYAFEM
jgi:hypothetical protein